MPDQGFTDRIRVTAGDHDCLDRAQRERRPTLARDPAEGAGLDQKNGSAAAPGWQIVPVARAQLPQREVAPQLRWHDLTGPHVVAQSPPSDSAPDPPPHSVSHGENGSPCQIARRKRIGSAAPAHTSLERTSDFRGCAYRTGCGRVANTKKGYLLADVLETTSHFE